MPEIRDAATVVVLREQGSPFEILMLRRHHGHEFMANAWVFPGGRVEERDRTHKFTEHLKGFDAVGSGGRLEDEVDAQTALGLYCAGLRETFEEAGLLIACEHREDSLSFESPSRAKRFDTLRNAVDAGELGLAELAEEEELEFDAEGLVYFAHWITPDFEPKRYDTRFFAALAPPSQQHSHDEAETTHSAWWTPEEAIERYRNEEILLAPPTLRILEELQRFSGPDEALRGLRSRPTPPAIMPHPVEVDGDRIVLALPGDPEYPGGVDAPEDGVTRMERRDGQWFSVAKGGRS